ncbi:hypothetical protein EG327_008158 [Venturia inaequalis]|uniref:FAS1 domain-containing protein n=1 Tax=Venturia inaequalis TaxID=5025 RepID=A0A8H3UV87_VENIN|nr:hypothetical protein EG327_008158 [Venturia inaequalis]
MYQSLILPNLSFLFLSIFVERGQADCLKDVAGNGVKVWCPTVACGSPDPPNNEGVTFIAVQNSGPGDKLKRELWDPLLLDNSTWPPPEYTYQVSPYYKLGAVLRECSGSIVTSYDTIHANLNGRGQTFVSQRNASCKESGCTNAPIKLASGLGEIVTILKEDIKFSWGVMHIADKLFTTPLKLSATLNITSPATFKKLFNAFIAYDNIPSTTFFIPSDTALSKSCSYTLAPGEARTLMNAQSVKDFVAYSPSLVDGAFFKAGNGEDITITVKEDGTKYANNIKIVQQDIIVENGVVHMVDGLFSSPSTSCAGPPVSKAITVISTIYQQSTVQQPGLTIYQPGSTVTTTSTATLVPTTCVPEVPGSSCPAPSTVRTTILPTGCLSQGPGSSCTNPVTSTSTIFPATCASQVSGSSCTPVVITLPPTGCSTLNAYCPSVSSCLPGMLSTSTTTTTITGPPGPTIFPSCPSGTTCSPATPCNPGTTTSISTSIVPGPPGPTSYITLSICPLISQPPSTSYSREDCDEFGKPYGPNNPRPGLPNSAICNAMGGCGGSTPTAPATPTVNPTTPIAATPVPGGSPGGGYGHPPSGNWGNGP